MGLRFDSALNESLSEWPLHLHPAAKLDIIGLWLMFFGLVFLFIYGMPFDLPGIVRRNRRPKHVFFGFLGLAAILFGTLYQTGSSAYNGLGF